MTVFNQLPTDPRLAAKVVHEEFEDVRRAREMGKIGAWIGSPAAAPTYVAGILACFFAICLVLVIFVPIGQGMDRKDAAQMLGGFLLASLGYLFGSLTGGSKQ